MGAASVGHTYSGQHSLRPTDAHGRTAGAPHTQHLLASVQLAWLAVGKATTPALVCPHVAPAGSWQRTCKLPTAQAGLGSQTRETTSPKTEKVAELGSGPRSRVLRVQAPRH